MYFKKLELYGFKSFVDKTSLIFEPGVTAIVGPNGTGKSNIADAIKWVLGEQSAKSMRGSKMEDVIFNGTDTRPPVNFAEISLTLSNEARQLPIDYDEVTITRRLYRSGESEYLLNKTPVRLKDINELLMGTGIGTESYSLLEQGRIDVILSSKPEDRRIIFEEASGITKFKSKKNEALRKLEQTEENLLRVNDIVTEVNRQLNSIQRQVNKARRYQEEFERLKLMETQYAYRQYHGLKMQKQQLEEERNQLRTEQMSLEEETAKFLQTFDELKRILVQVESDYNQITHKVINAGTQIEKNEHRMHLNKERIEEFKQRINNLSADMENAEKRIAELQEQLAQLNQRMAVFQEDKITKEKHLQSKQTAIVEIETQIRQANEAIERSKISAVTVLSEQAKIKNELAKTSANLHNIHARLTRLQQEKAKTSEELKGIDLTLQEKINELRQLKNRVDEKEKKESELRLCREDFTRGLKKIETELQNLKQALIAKQSQLHVLEEVSQTYEGFSGAVKALMQKRNENPEMFYGVHDVLVNLIEVNLGYEVCVENALSEYLQAVIVENKQVILRLKDFLSAQGIGRVRFIALDSLPAEEAVVCPAENLQKITDVIRCEEKYKKVTASLLKNTFLIKADLPGQTSQEMRKEDMFNKCEGFNFSDKLVTLQGEIYSRAELISRPVVEQGLGLISQKAQMRQLREECAAAEKNIAACVQEEGIKREQLKSIEVELAQVTEILHQEKIDLANMDSVRGNIESSRKKLDEELSILNIELEETIQDEDELKVKEAECKQNLEEIEQRILKNEQEMIQSQDLVKGKAQEREELLVIITKMKAEFALLNEQEATLNENFSMVKQNLQEQTDSLNGYERQKKEAMQRIEELSAEVSELELNTKTLREEKQRFETELQGISARRNELLAEFEQTQQQIKAKEDKINQVKNQLRDLDVKTVELNFKMDALTSNVCQSYKVELPDLVLEIPEGIDWLAQEKEIEAIKNKLDRLGSVNLAAVEEEEELKERANFLNSQKEDLVTAKESLMQAIQKINKTTRSLFMETFEKTKETFREYFKLLFNGGDAQLYLSDEKDILESGVEIAVRPPGKKLQNISLLSGGEKTLTAIALLFAVFKVKPTPFCVMDEMDAPLDESNIDRFTRVLQEFVKSSQFIIITHNKKTIGMADVMYGITMEQPGISKLVSVKFSDYREQPAEQQEAATPLTRPDELQSPQEQEKVHQESVVG